MSADDRKIPALRAWDASPKPMMEAGSPSVQELWERYRSVAETASDLQAMLERAEQRLERWYGELRQAQAGDGRYSVMDEGLRKDNLGSLRELCEGEKNRVKVLTRMLDSLLVAGEVPTWQQASKATKKSLEGAAEDAPQYSWKRQSLINGLKVYFEKTPPGDTPHHWNEFFREVQQFIEHDRTVGTLHTTLQTFCQDTEGLHWPDEPNGLRDLLNQT